jgi:hypothetical protein
VSEIGNIEGAAQHRHSVIIAQKNEMAKRATLIPNLFVNAAGRYIGKNGQFLSPLQIRHIVDDDIENTARRFGDIARALQDGDIGLGEFRAQMAASIKHLDLANLCAGKGGLQNLDFSDYGRAGQRIRAQYEYLNNFVSQLSANPELINDAQFFRRAQSYAQAGRVAFEKVRLQDQIERGAVWARRVLHRAEHCKGCIGGAKMGWVLVSQIVPIGGYECNVFCHCTIEYSYSIDRPND